MDSHHTIAGPAKKLDGIDYALKFSTEIAVLALSLIVIVFNLTGSQNLQNFTSNNLFSKELAYRPNANKLLYNKTTAITTDLATGNRFIPSASAQIVLASNQNNLSASAVNVTIDPNINDNSITQPNPDSVKTMILDQIQSYTVQPGDTLASIAEKFNLQPNTIIWANNITNNKVTAGQTLQILPTDGVIHTVTANDTLPDIAKVYKADINQIISYNNLTDVNDINPGDILIIPDGVVTPPPAPKPVAPIKHVIKGGGTVFEPAYDSSILQGNHVFPYGQCTYYVALRRDSMGKDTAVTWGGNAKSWLYNATAQGYATGKVAKPGAIVVTNENRRYGHVALVERIEGDQILVSEMNYDHWGVVDQRWISLNSGVIRGYIY